MSKPYTLRTHWVSLHSATCQSYWVNYKAEALFGDLLFQVKFKCFKSFCRYLEEREKCENMFIFDNWWGNRNSVMPSVLSLLLTCYFSTYLTRRMSQGWVELFLWFSENNSYWVYFCTFLQFTLPINTLSQQTPNILCDLTKRVFAHDKYITWQVLHLSNIQTFTSYFALYWHFAINA